jgi:1,4-dihydroxy-2-naphthoate octaprenyltransferase
MTTETARPINPEPDQFAGEALPRVAKRLFHATRPKFYPASVLPVIAGTAWGVSVSGALDMSVFLLALLATVCVHAAGNVLNDVDDESNGTDRRNESRIYPYTGGSRFIQTGIVDQGTMARLGYALLGLAAVIGLVLLLLKGPVVLLFGLAGVALGLLYSMGPARLSALGLGEAAVGVAFGILPVAGAAWLQGAALEAPLYVFAAPVSLWVAAILLINEVPDIEADAAVGKRTLPVRFGLGGTALIYLGLHASAALAIVYLSMMSHLPVFTPLLPLALLALAFKASVAIRAGVRQREPMAKAIESTLAIHTLGSLWLIGCVLYLWWSAG